MLLLLRTGISSVVFFFLIFIFGYMKTHRVKRKMNILLVALEKLVILGQYISDQLDFRKYKHSRGIPGSKIVY